MKNKKITHILFFLLLSIMGSPKLHAQSYNYSEVLQKSMFFYQSRQSGKLPPENTINWRGASALKDGSDVGKDLTGGWYDAGDNVKFGFPMAYSATVLAWGYLDFPNGYINSGQQTALLKNLRFVYDYFIKCHTAPNVLYGQVGLGGTDHSFWGSPEIMPQARPSFSIDATHPGTELAMETAAALAAGSMVFKTVDPSYSAILLSHARQLYSFGSQYRGVYTKSILDAANYYQSFSGYQDELCWGSIWLYRATNSQVYLDSAKQQYNGLQKTANTPYKNYTFTMNWDDVSYGCYALMAKVTGIKQYITDLEQNLDFWTTGFNGSKISYTPGGLAWLSQYGTLRYTAAEAYLALFYNTLPNANPTKKQTYLNFAKSQINYMLGANPLKRSFVAGFGVNPPINLHHRGAHGSWTNDITSPTNNRHILYGALVGGPDLKDNYTDDRQSYSTNEPACDYNAAFSGALSSIISTSGIKSSLPPIPKEVPNGEFLAKIHSNSSGVNYFEPAVTINNQTSWPARICTKLSFRYFIDITEGVAKGYTINNYTVAKGGFAPDATLVPGFTQWSGNIYYVEVDYNNVQTFYPGGQSQSQRQCQFRISGPNGAWDPTNDFSYKGVGATDQATNYVPMYENGKLVFGTEPPKGPVTLFTINSSAGNGGSISPSGSVNIVKGSQASFTITPSSGYQINSVLVNNIAVGAVGIYTFNNVQSNQTISATFKPISNQSFTITASAGANGIISPTGIKSEVLGSTATFTFTPNSGYQVNSVIVDGVSQGSIPSYTFTNINANHTISVTFQTIPAGSCLLVRFGVPRTSALPSIYTPFNYVYTLGQNAPVLTGVDKGTINWNATNNGLYELSFHLQKYPYYTNFNTSPQNFSKPSPAITFTGTGFPGLDGRKYYVNIVDGGNFVFVESTGAFALYFSNSATAPLGCSGAATLNSFQILNQAPILDPVLYPNPSSNFVTIDNLPTETTKTISINSLDGQLIMTKISESGSSKINLDMHSFPKGIYLITIKSGNNKIVKRFVNN